MEFFKDIYPVQLIDQTPDYAVALPVNVKVACVCPGGEAPIKWNGTGNLFLDFPIQKGALKSISLTNSTGSRFDGARATGTTGHFAAGDFDLEAGLIGQFKSPEK